MQLVLQLHADQEQSAPTHDLHEGLKAKDLMAVVDFIYHGELNILQEDLDKVLAVADDLKLKGPSCSNDNT